MIVEIEQFASALENASGASRNTAASYQRDLKNFSQYLIAGRTAVDEHTGAVQPDLIRAEHVRNYLAELLRRGASRATVQRRLFAVKAYFRWRELAAGKPNPASTMRSPRAEKRLPQVLSEDDTAALVEADHSMSSRVRLRDRA